MITVFIIMYNNTPCTSMAIFLSRKDILIRSQYYKYVGTSKTSVCIFTFYDVLSTMEDIKEIIKSRNSKKER